MDGKEQVGQDQIVQPLTETVEDKGQDSQDKTNHSSEPEKVYTQKEVETLIAKRHGTLDKRIITMEKQLTQVGNTAAENAELRKQITDLSRRHEEAELDRYKDDPDMYDLKKKELDITRREGMLSAKQAEVESWMDENKSILDRLNQFDMLVTASELAKEYEIDPTDLLELGASTPEQMKKQAEYLAKKPKGTLAPGEKPAEKPKGMKPDSSVGAGAGIDFTGMSPRDIIKLGLSQK